MRTLVIYDTEYGNTKQIAEAVAEALKDYGETRILSVSEAGPLDAGHINLLAMGGPTHAHGLSEHMRDFLLTIPEGALSGVGAITFDTRFDMPTILTGSASSEIEKWLKKLGCLMLLPHESFFIKGREGPLAVGEVERAAEWARTAANRIAPVAEPVPSNV